MLKLIRRWWRYFTAKGEQRFAERADPKVQLEQAIGEAQEQHRRLVEQAANVIANQKQTEIRLNRAMEELERLNGSTRQAVVMADDATKRGDGAKAREFTTAAEAFANRMIATEREVESLKQLHLGATEAANQAKAAVAQNSSALQTKLTERQKLLSQLDQAKMQEQVNQAMATLSQAVGQDVPTFDEVRLKIEARYARALGASEVASQSVEHHMLEVEQAQLTTEAQTRLASIRTQLGIGTGGPAAVGSGAADEDAAAIGSGAAADTVGSSASAAGEPGAVPTPPGDTPAP